MTATSRVDLTTELESGDADGHQLDRVFPAVYAELRVLARRQLARERSDHTLSTTALIHEAYLKLVDQTRLGAHGRAYFFGAAAQAMRQVLVDYARQRGRQKRGSNVRPVRLAEEHLIADAFAVDVLDLHNALDALATIDERSARVVEYRYFGGLDTDEIATLLGVSPRTVKRDWIMAKAWLYRALQDQRPD